MPKYRIVLDGYGDQKCEYTFSDARTLKEIEHRIRNGDKHFDILIKSKVGFWTAWPVPCKLIKGIERVSE